jgi:8-oxo-dGTP diphosphatase
MMAEPGEYRYPYPRPAVGVDCLVFTLIDGRLNLLLIRRGHDPFAGCWAFPGGFVDENEPLDAAARRELLEETGVRATALHAFGAYGDPGRDPRGWILSAPFYTVVASDSVDPAGADDAAEAAWRPVHRPGPLAFDHGRILSDALARLRRDLYFAPIAKPLLPPAFTARELHEVYIQLDPHAPPLAALQKRLVDARVITAAQNPKSWKFAANRRRP